jgi:hypothetical protein
MSLLFADAWMAGSSGDFVSLPPPESDYERPLHHPFEDVALHADTGDSVTARSRADRHHGRLISIFGDEYLSFLCWVAATFSNPQSDICLTGVFWVLLSRTVWGRHVYAVGERENGASNDST